MIYKLVKLCRMYLQGDISDDAFAAYFFVELNKLSSDKKKVVATVIIDGLQLTEGEG